MTPILRPSRLCLAALALVFSLGNAQAKPAAAPPAPHPKEKTQTPAKPPPEPPIRIGEIFTYKKLPAFSAPYRHGWELAVEQINAGGGVLGRKIEVLSRDDHGIVDDAVKAAQQLVTQDKVLALFGGYSSEVGLGLSHYAAENKVLYLAVAPLSQRLTWQEGNRYTYRVRASAWMLAAAVAPKALGKRKLRWALVYLDDESDRSTVDAFKGLMKTFQSKTDFVYDLPVPKDKFDAAATVKAIVEAKPDAVFNTLTGANLVQLVREGNAQQLFDDRPVVSLFTGDPENLDALDNSVPADWVITGYPRDAIDTPANQDFVKAYRDRYGDAPRTASVLGYVSMMSLAAGLKRAAVADGEKLARSFSGLNVGTPFGDIEYRSVDHQSTLGTYLGYTASMDGKAAMDRFVYATGKRLQPLDEQVRRLRPDGTGKTANDDNGKGVIPPAVHAERKPSGNTRNGTKSGTDGDDQDAQGRAPEPDIKHPPPALSQWPEHTVPPGPALTPAPLPGPAPATH